MNESTPPLEAFASLVNEHFTLGKSKNITYYLPLLEEPWQMAVKNGHIDTPATEYSKLPESTTEETPISFFYALLSIVMLTIFPIIKRNN